MKYFFSKFSEIFFFEEKISISIHPVQTTLSQLPCEKILLFKKIKILSIVLFNFCAKDDENFLAKTLSIIDQNKLFS